VGGHAFVMGPRGKVSKRVRAGVVGGAFGSTDQHCLLAVGALRIGYCVRYESHATTTAGSTPWAHTRTLNPAQVESGVYIH
jgi:hypothetical protein